MVAAIAGASPLVILGLLAAGGAVPYGVVSFRVKRRARAFEDQLPEILTTIAATLKAGHSFKQGMQAVVDEAHPPASEELRSGCSPRPGSAAPMDDALTQMAERTGSENFSFAITAVTIQRQVGGSLAGLFEMVADTVRQRQQFARKIRGLTAMGRMSAYVLIGLPFFIALAITVMNPEYMAPLYHTSAGHMLILIGLAMMTVGSLIIHKIVSFKGCADAASAILAVGLLALSGFLVFRRSMSLPRATAPDLVAALRTTEPCAPHPPSASGRTCTSGCSSPSPAESHA